MPGEDDALPPVIIGAPAKNNNRPHAQSERKLYAYQQHRLVSHDRPDVYRALDIGQRHARRETPSNSKEPTPSRILSPTAPRSRPPSPRSKSRPTRSPPPFPTGTLKRRRSSPASRSSATRLGIICWAIHYKTVYPFSPQIPPSNQSFLKPLDDMAALWAQVNALPATGAGSIAGFTPPLLLIGAYPIATFTADLAALRAAYLAVSNAQVNAKVAREKRDVLLPNLRLRMGQYRKAILALYAPNDPLVMSLPSLTAPSGSTPDPVSVSGKWDAALGKGVLTILPSDDPKLDYYSVRTAPPPTYKANDETVIGRIEKGETTFETTTGLAASGSVGLFKVYVTLTTGKRKRQPNGEDYADVSHFTNVPPFRWNEYVRH